MSQISRQFVIWGVYSGHPNQTQPDTPEVQIIAILEYRFGDGLVRLPGEHPNQLLALVNQHGFIDADDYLTRKGRSLLACYH